MEIKNNLNFGLFFHLYDCEKQPLLLSNGLIFQHILVNHNVGMKQT